ncbi:MAG: T9SS type A sorting domain-containing protein [Bacteroidota bacterium]
MQRLLYLILCYIVAGITTLHGQSLSVEFPADTIHACINEGFEIGPSVTGGQAPYTYDWSDGTQDSVLTILPTQTLYEYQVIVTDGTGEVDSATVFIHALDECVWPGDANGDGAANNQDILNLGLAYGHTGYVRPNAHTNWIGQPAHSWAIHHAGIDFAHVDGDGNGLIDTNDILPIEKNYLTPSTSGQPTSPNGSPLYVQFNGANAQPGDTVVATVLFGTVVNQFVDLHGIAFSLTLEGVAIDSGSVQVNYNQSVLGQQPEILTVDKAFYDKQIVDIGITRFDSIGISGFGKLAEIIVVIDEIIAKKAGIETMNFKLEDVVVIDRQGQLVPVRPVANFINVITSIPEIELEEDWSVATLEEEWALSRPAYQILPTPVQVFDLQGRLIYSTMMRGQRLNIPFEKLNRGVYLLQAGSGKNKRNAKIFRP